TLEVIDRGGHSASGRRDNGIYRLADALRRLGQFHFPIHLDAITRAFFERVRALEAPAAAHAINAMLARQTHGAPAMQPLTPPPQLTPLHPRHLRGRGARGRHPPITPCRRPPAPPSTAASCPIRTSPRSSARLRA